MFRYRFFIYQIKMGALVNKYIQFIIVELEKDAKRILQECVDERTYTHRTMNLYDSYGYGIYLKGTLVKTGFLSASPSAKSGKRIKGTIVKGRDEIIQYLNHDYAPREFIDLAVVATMPYARTLEEGSGGLKNKYRVISMSLAKLQSIASKYGANVHAIR